MTKAWLRMRYRDFYDIPRAIVVEWHGQLYLFDCLYDYQHNYTLYRLPDELREKLEDLSWTDLGHRGEEVGAIATSDLEFDTTKRETLNAAIFDQLGLQ